MKNYKVAFVDYAYSLDVFEHVFTELKSKHEIDSVFITLLKNKPPEQYTHTTISLAPNIEAQIKEGMQIVHALEQQYPDFRVNLAINSDRFLKWWPRKKAIKILCQAASQYISILEREKPNLVVGEISTAIEYMFFFIAELYGIPYRHLLNLPGKEVRLVLFDYAHSSKSTLKLGKSEDPLMGSGLSYSDLCQDVKEFRPSIVGYLKSFSKIYSTNDYRKSLLYKSKHLMGVLYAIFYKVLEFWLGYDDYLKDKKSVLFTFHIQPESTPDFVSIFYSNQIELAKKFSEAVDDNTLIYIKEHPNKLSIRNPFALLSLLLKKNVKLIKRDVPTSTLLPRTDIITTVAGTIAIEAAAFGKPTIIFSDIFYNELNNVIDGRKFKSLSDAVAYCTNNNFQIYSNKELYEWLKQFGLPGFIHDPRIAPGVIRKENIRCISKIITSFLTTQSRKSS